MKITESAIQGAIFKMLRNLNVGIGSRIQLPELNREWRKTGLRGSDLIDGLASLCSAGSLTYEDSDRGSIVVNTASSQSLLKSDVSLLQRFARTIDDSLLRIAAMIRPRSSPSQYERRQKSFDYRDLR